MASNLAGYIKEERVKQGLNYAELSRKMGRQNINRGMRRIVDLEREGMVHPEVLKKIIDALELDEGEVNKFIMKDEEERLREFEEWVSTPIKWNLIIRWIPTVYGERDIPGYIKNEDEAIKFAKGIAKKLKSMVWLVLSRKENIHIDKAGNIKSRNIETIDCSWLPGERLK